MSMKNILVLAQVCVTTLSQTAQKPRDELTTESLALESCSQDKEESKLSFPKISAHPTLEHMPETSQGSRFRNWCISTMICFFLLLLYLPWVQQSLNIFPRVGLNNIKVPKSLTPPTLSSFLSGKFQKKAETWATRKSGFWGVLVRSENQLNYSLFGQPSSSYSSSLAIGEKSTLFEKIYLDSWNNRNRLSEEQLLQLANRLALLQQLLSERGIAFILLISPSKAATYPELISPALKTKEGGRFKQNRELLMPLLQNLGVNVIDSSQIVSRTSQSVPYPSFSKCGTHWSSIGSCPVTSEIAQLIGQLLKKPVKQVSCGPELKVHNYPKNPDRDLAIMLNVWNASSSCEPTAEFVTNTSSPDNHFQPKVLFVGTSFLWAVLDYLDRMRFYSSRYLFFYFRTSHSFLTLPNGQIKRERKEIDHQNFDWERRVFSNDVILVEANEASIHTLGHDFIEQAIKKLSPLS